MISWHFQTFNTHLESKSNIREEWRKTQALVCPSAHVRITYAYIRLAHHWPL